MAEVNLDAAIAELNGNGMPPLAPGDKPHVQSPARDHELTIEVDTPSTPIRAADAVHSTAVGGKGYLVDVAGEYYAVNPEGKGKVKKPYELKDIGVPKLEGCLSTIKNRLLKQLLLKRHPDFVSDRTCYIVRTRPAGPGVDRTRNVAFMDRQALEAVVKDRKIPVDLTTFDAGDKGTAALRESVVDFMQNPDPVRIDDKGRNTVNPGDVGTFVYRERIRQATREEYAALAALNPGVDVGV